MTDIIVRPEDAEDPPFDVAFSHERGLALEWFVVQRPGDRQHRYQVAVVPYQDGYAAVVTGLLLRAETPDAALGRAVNHLFVGQSYDIRRLSHGTDDDTPRD